MIRFSFFITILILLLLIIASVSATVCPISKKIEDCFKQNFAQLQDDLNSQISYWNDIKKQKLLSDGKWKEACAPYFQDSHVVANENPESVKQPRTITTFEIINNKLFSWTSWIIRDV